MAGSYTHVVDDQGRFRGVDLLDNLGDAYEALEEMYGMVWYLASELATDAVALVEEARQNYALGIERSPGVNVDE